MYICRSILNLSANGHAVRCSIDERIVIERGHSVRLHIRLFFINISVSISARTSPCLHQFEDSNEYKTSTFSANGEANWQAGWLIGWLLLFEIEDLQENRDDESSILNARSKCRPTNRR